MEKTKKLIIWGVVLFVVVGFILFCWGNGLGLDNGYDYGWEDGYDYAIEESQESWENELGRFDEGRYLDMMTMDFNNKLKGCMNFFCVGNAKMGYNSEDNYGCETESEWIENYNICGEILLGDEFDGGLKIEDGEFKRIK